MEKEALTPEVEQEVKAVHGGTAEKRRDGTYSAVRVDQSDTISGTQSGGMPCSRCGSLHIGIRPEKDELYYFAMNGQTGKICGKLPVAKGKLVKLFLEIFVPVAAILMIGGWFL